MKSAKWIALLTAALFGILAFTACGDDQDEPEYNPSAEKLKGTTWHYYKKVEHLAHRDQEERRDYYLTFLPTVASKSGYKVKVKGVDSSDLSWRFDFNSDSGRERLWIESASYYPSEIIKAICCSLHDVISWTDDELVLGNDTHEIYLKRVPFDEFQDDQSGSSDNKGDNDEGDNGGNTGGNTGGSGDNDDNENPYTNYIHYRYCQTDYYHEIKCVKQEVEFAPPGTIHGWNYRYLNVYIGNYYKVGFQFESAYFEDEYPPTSPWPAMEYEITSTSASALSHFPIARVFFYDNDMKFYTQYPILGKGEIKYLGNKMIFDFTSNGKGSADMVDVHFEGTLSY